MLLDLLPLAVTMMAGPQIMTAIIFVTTEKPVVLSLAFLLGALGAMAVGVTLARGVAALLGSVTSFGAAGDPGAIGTIIQLVLVALLAAYAIHSYATRRTAKPPRWLGDLMSMTPRRALAFSFVLVLVMPTDVMAMLTVGAALQQHDTGLGGAVPFVILTLAIGALPLLAYLLFRKRALRAMPHVRDWMNTHSWLINILVCLLFIWLILS